jgi:hypothetical protein
MRDVVYYSLEHGGRPVSEAEKRPGWRLLGTPAMNESVSQIVILVSAAA